LEDIPLHVIHLSQDDPQKCTSRKMARHGLTELHHDIRHTPRRGILLNPLSGRILGPDDAGEFSRG
jgi:pre-rRNA-processing protein TSR3